MNTPVSFELAKLLKEKGIIFVTEIYYSSVTKVTSISYAEIAAPTISDVVMWLYEKHGIWIGVYDLDDTTIFRHCFSNIDFNSPTDAYSSAIEYTLNNLI